MGATETALMAAALARGETEILNAARDPEVCDLALCLAAMGAKIEGAGTHHILVQGADALHNARHELLTDRIEAGTYAVAAAITGGHLEILGAHLEHLGSVGAVLESAGAQIWPTDRGLMVVRSGPLRAVDVVTEPYPGFPTDLQAQFMALMTIAPGASVIRETIYENRFMHVPELGRLGASISLQGSTALVRGVEKLHGAEVMATDLRASISLVLAALVAEGETTINRVTTTSIVGMNPARPQARSVWSGHPAGRSMTAALQPGPLFIGVDGGGTGCRARIEDASGCLLGTGIGGPAALRLGIDRALSEVEKACHVALGEAGLGPDAMNSAHAAVGLAGVGRKGADRATPAAATPVPLRRLCQ